MSEKSKYITPVYLPKCDYCGSNILQHEKYYFAALEGRSHGDVRIVHRECYARNQTHFAREEYERSKA